MQDEKKCLGEEVVVTTTTLSDQDEGRSPTEVRQVLSLSRSPSSSRRRHSQEELKTLRLVAGPMPWAAVGMCLIEFAERASYVSRAGTVE